MTYYQCLNLAGCVHVCTVSKKTSNQPEHLSNAIATASIVPRIEVVRFVQIKTT